MTKEVTLCSGYGPGGRLCVCCGPSPRYRKKFDRMVMKRVRRMARHEIQQIIKNEKEKD